MKIMPSPTDDKVIHLVINDPAKKKKKRRRRGKTVRTLYISRLPGDAKPREIYLMFRSFTGYQSSMLLSRKEGKKPTPVAFVTFENREQAKVAEKALHGKRFDPDQPINMNIEFAKENTKNEKISHITTSQNSNYTNAPSPLVPNVPTFPGTINGPICTQESCNVTDVNFNNMSFPPPFFFGMSPLPINYPGVMLSPPSPYIPYQNHTFVPTPTPTTAEDNVVQPVQS